MKKKIAISLFFLFISSIYFFFGSRTPKVRKDIAYEFNSTYLVNLKPNYQKQYIRHQVNGGDTIIWKSNSQKFRGKEIKNRAKKVVVYGDSNIHARFSHLKDTYCAQLENLLNKQVKDSIEVINAGIVGFGPDQSLLRFEEEKSELKPDIVILNIFADNDFGDNIRNRLLELDKKGALVKVPYTPVIDETFLDNPSAQLWRSLRLIEGKDLYNRIMANFRGANENMRVSLEKFCHRQLKIYKNKAPRLYSITADQYDLDVATNPKSKDSLLKIKLMNAILKRFQQSAKQAKVELLVLIQPSSLDLCKNMPFNHQYLQENFPNYQPTHLTSELEKICEQNDINYLNLYPIFQNNQPESLYFKGDNHWNNKGQLLAAKTMATFLLENHNSLLSKE